MSRPCAKFALNATIVAAAVSVTLVAPIGAQAPATRPLPTSEQFNSLLTSCAAGADIKLSADLVGSVRSIYDAQRTQGAASFSTSTEFLKLIPEASRLEAYQLYTRCIRDIVLGKQEGPEK